MNYQGSQSKIKTLEQSSYKEVYTDKNKLYKKDIKSKSTYYHIRFKLYENKIHHLLEISQKWYYNQYFPDNITNGKKIWRGIKQIVHFKPNTNKKLVKIMHGQQQ